MLIIIFSKQNSVPFTATRGCNLASGYKGKKKTIVLVLKRFVCNYMLVAIDTSHVFIIATSMNYIRSFSPLVTVIVTNDKKYLCF